MIKRKCTDCKRRLSLKSFGSPDLDYVSGKCRRCRRRTRNPAFTPKPIKSPWAIEYINHLLQMFGSVRLAAVAARVSYPTFYRYMRASNIKPPIWGVPCNHGNNRTACGACKRERMAIYKRSPTGRRLSLEWSSKRAYGDFWEAHRAFLDLKKQLKGEAK